MERADERLREARFIDATENALGTIESNEFTDARLQMTTAAFDPTLIDKYNEPKSLLHFQWGNDSKVYRYALVEIIDEKEIDPKTKCKKDEQGLTQQEIFKKICQEQHQL